MGGTLAGMDISADKPFPRYESIVDDYAAFCAALSRPLPVTLWANPERIEVEELRQQLQGAGMNPEVIPWYPGGFRLPAGERAGKRWEFFAGLYQIQEEAAMLPVALLDPQPGELVLDMCAAPGNKTAQIAFAMDNRGTVLANDLNRKRIPALRQTCERLGLRNVAVINYNGSNIAGHAARFDRILVDAPCSCEGTTRKNPNQGMQSELHFSAKQRGAQAALLHKAAQLCKVGGRIVYSTCTYAPEENEAVVDEVLEAYGHENLRIVECALPPPFTAGHGLTEWEGRRFHADLSRSIRVWPHQNDTGGFFVTVLEKTAERESHGAQPPNDETTTLPAEDAQPLHEVIERYGVTERTIAGLRTIRGKGEQMFLLPEEFCMPSYFESRDIGLRTLRTDSEMPKPAHPGAMFLGQHAGKNIVQLASDRAAAFMRRKALDLEPEEMIECDGGGFVLVKCGTACVGVGILCTADDGHKYLVSNFPRRWAARLGE